MGGDMETVYGRILHPWKNYNRYAVKGFSGCSHIETSSLWPVKPFNYSASANMTYSTSKWLRYPDSLTRWNGAKSSVPAWINPSAWEAEGLYRTEEELIIPLGTAVPSRQRYHSLNLNGDSQIDGRDKARIGRSNPS